VYAYEQRSGDTKSSEFLNYSGGGTGTNIFGSQHFDLGRINEQLKQHENEIVTFKGKLAESISQSREQCKKLATDLNRLEDRLNYHSCCSLQ
jgi:hypothetical protein